MHPPDRSCQQIVGDAAEFHLCIGGIARSAGQEEMLLPIAGKKPKEIASKKTAGNRGASQAWSRH